MSTTQSLVHRTVGTALSWRDRVAGLLRARDERGLSQSTEQALLVAGAVAVGTIIAGAVLLFVRDRLAAAGLEAGG
jgi:hypothetical protein